MNEEEYNAFKSKMNKWQGHCSSHSYCNDDKDKWCNDKDSSCNDNSNWCKDNTNAQEKEQKPNTNL